MTVFVFEPWATVASDMSVVATAANVAAAPSSAAALAMSASMSDSVVAPMAVVTADAPSPARTAIS